MAIFKKREQDDGNRMVADICRDNVSIPEVIAFLERQKTGDVSQVEDDCDLRAKYLVNDPNVGKVRMRPVFNGDMTICMPPKSSKSISVVIRDKDYTVLSLRAINSSYLACPFVVSSTKIMIDRSKFDALIAMLNSIQTIEATK